MRLAIGESVFLEKKIEPLRLGHETSQLSIPAG